jgi:hypothetical protein
MVNLEEQSWEKVQIILRYIYGYEITSWGLASIPGMAPCSTQRQTMREGENARSCREKIIGRIGERGAIWGHGYPLYGQHLVFHWVTPLALGDRY